MRALLRLLAPIVLVAACFCAGCSDADRAPGLAADGRASANSTQEGKAGMPLQYLEIVTPDVDAVCATYAAALGASFGAPDAALGNARTAPLPGGGMVGVRAPLRETEAPVLRPYWLVQDIEAAVAAAVKAGGELALPPMELPGHGTCAIYFQGGVEHGLWQR